VPTYLRRSLIGMLAGLFSSVVLAVTMRNVPLAVLLGIVVGVGYAAAFRPVAHAYVDSLMSAASMAVPLWALLNIVVFPWPAELLGGVPTECGVWFPIW